MSNISLQFCLLAYNRRNRPTKAALRIFHFMTAALRYCLRIASYSLFVCFLVACGRSQDIANPQPLAEEPVPDCPRTEDLALVSSISILGNVAGGSQLSTIPLLQAGPEAGFESAIESNVLGFDSSSNKSTNS